MVHRGRVGGREGCSARQDLGQVWDMCGGGQDRETVEALFVWGRRAFGEGCSGQLLFKAYPCVHPFPHSDFLLPLYPFPRTSRSFPLLPTPGPSLRPLFLPIHRGIVRGVVPRGRDQVRLSLYSPHRGLVVVLPRLGLEQLRSLDRNPRFRSFGGWELLVLLV